METVHLLFRLLACSQVIFPCLYLLLHHRGPMGLLMAFTLFCIFCYLLIPPSAALFPYPPLHFALIVFGSMVPAALWVLSQWFFSDRRRIPVWLYVLVACYLGLGLRHWQARPLLETSALDAIIFDLLPQLIKLGLVLHVIYSAIAGRRAELINARLALRVPVAIGLAGLVVMVIVVEIWAGDEVPLALEACWSLLVFSLCLAANLYLFRPRQDFSQVFTHNTRPGPAAAAAVNAAATLDHSALIKDIEQLMAQRFYARHSLTLADLAQQVRVPQYRLRGVINQTMGYRNFNQFLNHYRIAEAQTRLLEQRQLPILSIALDVGFKSLSSFNKAFREKHSQTPSQYRNSH